MTLQKVVKETLQRAREIIDEQGWAQGTYRNHRGYCVLGALAQASWQQTALMIPAKDLVWDTIQEQYPRDPTKIRVYVGIAGWNDSPGRTKDEVLAVLDKTILKLEEAV